ncbi:hypothetical protein AB0C47_34815 [Micromonospora taraxaci]|uniref:hypothetical protein n=1 Tax=Micromonospora taraxaci TaxID=1316803 RepID=UPI0033F6B78B
MALPGQKLRAPTFVRKIADEQLTSNATLQNDDELLLTGIAGWKYAFDGELRYSTNSTANLKWSFAIPGGATFVYSALYVPAGATALALTEFINSATGTADDSATRIRWRGLLDMGPVSGNLHLQWAQNTSNAGATLVQNFSYLRMDRVG